MTDALRRLVSSMKFWTAVLALVTLVAAKYGLAVDAELYWSIVGVFGALLAGQAVTDHGKSAAKEAGVAAVIAAGATQPSNTNVVVDARKSEAGFVDGFTMTCLAFVSLFMAVVVIATSCSHIGEQAKKTASSVVDCTSAKLAGSVHELRPLGSALLANAVEGGKVNWAPVRDVAKGFATDVGRCVFADAVTRLLAPAAPGAPKVAPLLADPVETRAGFRKLADELYGGQSFKTEAGAL